MFLEALRFPGVPMNCAQTVDRRAPEKGSCGSTGHSRQQKNYNSNSNPLPNGSMSPLMNLPLNWNAWGFLLIHRVHLLPINFYGVTLFAPALARRPMLMRRRLNAVQIPKNRKQHRSSANRNHHGHATRSGTRGARTCTRIVKNSIS